MRQPTYIDLCGGAGGFSLGFQWSGWRGLLGVDYEREPCITYASNFPSHPAVELSVHDLHVHVAVDCIIAGFPCPSHSMSGRRLGMQDERGEVFDGVARVIGEVGPEVFVFENVKGLLSSPGKDGKKGGALPYIIETMTGLGYTVEHAVLNANDHGTPQSRERIFIVGSRSGLHWVPPQPSNVGLTVYDALADLLEMDDEPDLPNHVLTKHGDDIVARIAKLGPGEGLYSGDVSPGRKSYSEGRQRLAVDLPSPTVKPNNGGLDIHPFKHRGLTPREMARLQGFPDDFVFHGSISSWVLQIGNAVPPPLAEAVADSVKWMVQ